MIAETEMRLIKKTASRQNAADKYYEEHKEKFHKLEKDVNKYYEKYKKEFLKSEKDILKIFEIDYDLRSEVKEKQS